MPGLSRDREHPLPECSGHYFSQIFLGKFQYPGNGIRERRPLLEQFFSDFWQFGPNRTSDAWFLHPGSWGRLILLLYFCDIICEWSLPVDVFQFVIRVTASFGIHPDSSEVSRIYSKCDQIIQQVLKSFFCSIRDHILLGSNQNVSMGGKSKTLCSGVCELVGIQIMDMTPIVKYCATEITIWKITIQKEDIFSAIQIVIWIMDKMSAIQNIAIIWIH